MNLVTDMIQTQAVRFQVLTAVGMKFRVFWDVALCNHIEVDRHFRGVYCLRHQGNDPLMHKMTIPMAVLNSYN
jgi:hypothetical protein